MNTFEIGFEKGLGDEVSEAFRNGTWNTKTQPEMKLLKAPEGVSVREEATLRARNLFIEKGVIEPFFAEDRSDTSLSQNEIDFYDFYCKMRTRFVSGLSVHTILMSKIHLESIKGTNIVDVHKYAEFQYDKLSRECDNSYLEVKSMPNLAWK